MGRGGIRVALVTALVALAAPGSALAAAKPTVTTGGVSNVAQTTAVLNGTVNPRGAETTYYFQYGTTRLYGANTLSQGAGHGTTGVKVAAGATGLAPATTYHYRIVAVNRLGTRVGGDRTFKTKRQPLGVTLAATPNPTRTNESTTLFGTLSGTGNAGRQVVLQANPFPYTQGFLNVANPQVTDAQGRFWFPVLSVPVNTQYRVLMPAKPAVVSPIVTVGTTLRVTTRVKVRRGEHRGRVRFTGTVDPGADGTEVVIQKLWHERWVTVGRTVAVHRNAESSRYRKTVRQRRGGRYRVVVNAQGAHTTSFGQTKHVRRVRR